MWALESKRTVLAVACSTYLPVPLLWKPWEILEVLRDIQTFHARYPAKKKSLGLLQMSDLFFCPFLSF